MACCKARKKWDDGRREVIVGIHSEQQGVFPPNTITTSKYTVWNFLCKNLWEQFHKLANTWFLLLSVLMAIGFYTPLFHAIVNPVPNVLTLTMLMSVTAVLNALDDSRRHKADEATNNAEVHRVEFSDDGSRGLETPAMARDLHVGDMIIIKANEEIQADVVLLASADHEGKCYVSTASLDGETNLKLKAAVESTQKLAEGSETSEHFLNGVLPLLSATVTAQPPSKSITDFEGSIVINGQTAGLEARNLLLRGTVLRNTAWCLGLVVYTGPQTRMMMNSKAAPSKAAHLDSFINKSVLLFIAMQGLLSLWCTINIETWGQTILSMWYLQPLQKVMLPAGPSNFLAFFALYSILVPITLFATIEACNFAQAYFINNDLEMYDIHRKLSAKVRTTNLCQEPGQVSYIFSDKTGTLTQNIMELKQLSINGKIYGSVEGDAGFGGSDVLAVDQQDKQQGEAIHNFFEVLAVGHTVLIDNTGTLQADNPDEEALVKAVGQLGWNLDDRHEKDMSVLVGTGTNVKKELYEILAVNSFDSTRKRMSMLVRKESGQHVLLIKGADNVMLERAKTLPPGLADHLHTFSCAGLRTLAVGRRELSASAVSSWMREYEQARVDLEDRNGALSRAAEKIEVDLDILGATAIEDKLQEDVAATIEKIRRAGINLWVLTGDKLETARNIGYSTKVLSQEMNVIVIEDLEKDGERQLLEEKMRAQTMEGAQSRTAMMVTGKALQKVTEQNIKEVFFELASLCSVVIAVRVSPSQKAEMVRLVIDCLHPSPVTLAIGDGNNDVSMIQEAHVGVGIMGREGRQAVNNADFAIGEFRFLAPLLFVHGRWNYVRITKVMLFTFWRSVLLVLLMFYYTFFTGGTGSQLFEDLVRGSFNAIPMFPTICTGIFDTDVDREDAMKFPEIFVTGREAKLLNMKKVLATIISTLIHSLLLSASMRFAYHSMAVQGVGDIYTFGSAVMTCLLLVTLYRLILITVHWNWIFWLAEALALAIYVIFMLIYGSLPGLGVINSDQMYMVWRHMISTNTCWVCFFAAPALSMSVDTVVAYLFHDDHVAKAIESGEAYMKEHEILLEQNQKKTKQRCLPFGTGNFDCSHVSDDMRTPQQYKRPISCEGSPKGKLRREFSCEQDPEEQHEDEENEDQQAPSQSHFAQQTIDGCTNCWHSHPAECACASTFLSGVLLVGLGAWAMISNRSVSQLKIYYEGGSPKSIFSGALSTSLEEVNTEVCPENKTCTFNVTVSKDMEPPILVYYLLEDFYQNVQDYVVSVSWKELRGLNTSQIHSQCAEETRLTADGHVISPCGLQAKSLFTDKFQIEQTPIDETGIAWESDLRRFHNVPLYPESPPDAEWLYKRFPRIVSEAEGVLNEHFAVWVRPSAFAEVHKTYGHINTKLFAGQNLTVRIENYFHVPGMRKELVLTTLSSFGGGRDETFSTFILVCGCLCFLLSALVGLVSLVRLWLSHECPGQGESEEEGSEEELLWEDNYCALGS